MVSNGYWINNEHVMWKHVIKPCKIYGICPYGQLVEDFPLPPIIRSIAKNHNEYMIKALADNVFDTPKQKESPSMTREEAEKEIADFNEQDYPEEISSIDKNMACKIFGHHCPVFYHAELLAEVDEPTPEEIEAFDDEIQETFEHIMKNRDESK